MGTGGVIPEGFRLEKGRLWPLADIGAAQVLFLCGPELEAAYAHCRGFEVAVQAGGNCGVWPDAMGRTFVRVYTFEPESMNYRCLCANAPADHVIKINAALGARPGTTGLRLRPENVGAHRIDGEGSVDVQTIDGLALTACDLIFLDVEGYEHHALAGAAETIRRCRPVVMFEDKGESAAYGIPKGETMAMLAREHGYQVVGQLHHNVIMAA